MTSDPKVIASVANALRSAINYMTGRGAMLRQLQQPKDQQVAAIVQKLKAEEI